jgi:hypothetical protein
MAFKNLTGFVKMAVVDNKNLDKETVDTLCQYMDDLKILIDNQDSLMKSLMNIIDAKDLVIKNLRKDLDGMGREVERLRELNNNQAWLIANNRTKRKDF